MHHKRRRPKHQRAGCLLCKPQKDERVAKTARLRVSEQRRLQPEVDDPLHPAELRLIEHDARSAGSD